MKKGKTPIKMYGGGDKVFLAACELAGKPATKRQYTKYGQKRGAAYLFKNLVGKAKP